MFNVNLLMVLSEILTKDFLVVYLLFQQKFNISKGNFIQLSKSWTI